MLRRKRGNKGGVRGRHVLKYYLVAKVCKGAKCHTVDTHATGVLAWAKADARATYQAPHTCEPHPRMLTLVTSHACHHARSEARAIEDPLEEVVHNVDLTPTLCMLPFVTTCALTIMNDDGGIQQSVSISWLCNIPHDAMMAPLLCNPQTNKPRCAFTADGLQCVHVVLVW